MKRTTTIGLINIATIFLFVACGSGKDNTTNYSNESNRENISNREYVIINYHYPKDYCTNSNLRERLEDIDATDIVISVEYNHVTCSTYGKRNDYQECGTIDYNYDNEPTCVVAVNHSSNYNSYYKSKTTNDIVFFEDINNIINSFF